MLRSLRRRRMRLLDHTSLASSAPKWRPSPASAALPWLLFLKFIISWIGSLPQLAACFPRLLARPPSYLKHLGYQAKNLATQSHHFRLQKDASAFFACLYLGPRAAPRFLSSFPVSPRTDAAHNPSPLSHRPHPTPPFPLVALPRPLAVPPRPLDAPPRPLAAPPRPLAAPPRPLDAPPRPLDAPPRPLVAPLSTGFLLVDRLLRPAALTRSPCATHTPSLQRTLVA
ncbi:hypothetical protein B0H11DRAFT_2368782 [Mycena galericulata]|nr:hypothetical protein B0H11DRAFT_2368782 [Mycena galericulata]